MKASTIVVVGILVFSVLANRITKGFALEKWQVSLSLLLLAGALYFLNIFLIRFFIKARTPNFARADIWELTAGLGIVPKWVSVIGFFSYSAFITAALPWVIASIKWLIIKIWG